VTATTEAVEPAAEPAARTPRPARFLLVAAAEVRAAILTAAAERGPVAAAVEAVTRIDLARDETAARLKYMILAAAQAVRDLADAPDRARLYRLAADAQESLDALTGGAS
jgi:hypothetical protein